ncbi:hypothetical protein IFM89_011328 [Coptis chinensis]|uniref:DUF4283 domain-containing protein n=1 Tax=Coptis chinensis TaxID=261450 RepID=A0A835IZJ1_9MAGN|nr:hypothetical protein IFM89_011328 [Coptis chinensis]
MFCSLSSHAILHYRMRSRGHQRKRSCFLIAPEREVADHSPPQLSYPYVKSILEKTWKIKGTMDITTDRDVFFIRMSTLEDKQMVLEGGPIFITATIVPIWAKLSKVPKELWTKNGLSFLASLIGGPLCMDGATSMKQRLDFAKVCVTILLEFDFPSSIKLKIREKHVYVNVEYPWKPPSCTVCCCFGHSTTKCPSSPAPVRVPRSSNADVQNATAVVRVPGASNVQNAPTAVWIPRTRTVVVQNVTFSVSDSQVISTDASSSATSLVQNTASLTITQSNTLTIPHMGPLLGTPDASLQERNSPLSNRSTLQPILGSSPFSLRASGSPSAFIRDRSNALRPSSSFTGRGNEVVVFSTPQVQQASTNQDGNILTEEELYNF